MVEIKGSHGKKVLMWPRIEFVTSRLMQKYRRFLPGLFFAGGFLWDAVTLGNSIEPLDLFILLAYLIAAALLLIGRERYAARRIPATDLPFALSEGLEDRQSSAPTLNERFSVLKRIPTNWPHLALQFLFGGLFSALIIFYFKSASDLPALFLIAGLAILLVLNEFLHNHYSRQALTWGLFSACAILFLNFALPHLLRSIHPAWFYLSTGLGVSLVWGLRKIAGPAKIPFWPPFLVAALFIALFMSGAIPPVPLVKKNMVIARELVREEGVYRAQIALPKPWEFWRTSSKTVYLTSGEPVYCFTSVFLPEGISTTLYHHWFYLDAKTRKWVSTPRIGFPIQGGRKSGYRGYTFKRNVFPAEWKVLVEAEDGRSLGSIRFQVEPAHSEAKQRIRELELN